MPTEMGTWERWYQIAIGAGIDPVILLAGFVIYATLRNITYKGKAIEKWQALLIVWPVNILGQIRISTGWSAWDDVLFFSIVQVGLAFGSYSLLEAVRAVELIKAVLGKFAKAKGVEVSDADKQDSSKP